MTQCTETFGNAWFSVTFVWQRGMLTAIDLTAQQLPPTPPCSSFGPELEGIVRKYDKLKADAWPDLPLDTHALTPFTQTVLMTLLHTTPRGTWTTYKQLATACGSPRGARAVGGVMARNPWPLYIPCHRVLAASMGWGGFGPGLALKQTLLSLEGVRPKAMVPR